MMRFLLASSVAENAKLGGMVALIGMVGVFVVLALLIICIKLISGGIARAAEKAEKAEAKEEEPQALAVEEVVSEASAEDNGSLIAAITAAITCFYDNRGGVLPQFVIRSVKPIKRR